MNNKTKRMQQRIWLILGFALVIALGSLYEPDPQQAVDGVITAEQLYEEQRSDVQLQIAGEVVRLLEDDNEGSRHQRFIIELASGQTLLVSHNIDLAPRIEDLQIGDDVEIYGEYVWNDQGGLMHWTHHDPANHHPHGWIRHEEKIYQ